MLHAGCTVKGGRIVFLEKAKEVDGLIFDVDGVLLDAERSFPEMIRRAVERGWENFFDGCCDIPGYSPKHQQVIKRHGAFNDDNDIAWSLLSAAVARGGGPGVCLSNALPTPEMWEEELKTLAPGGDAAEWVRERFGEVVSYEKILQLCQDLYFGVPGAQGLYTLETPMVGRRWDAFGLPVGIYTGRDLKELLLGFERLGWHDFPVENAVTRDSGVLKPSPEGLRRLCDRLSCRYPLFFGDTASDQMAQAAFGRGLFVAIGDLLPEAALRYDSVEVALADLLPSFQ